MTDARELDRLRADQAAAIAHYRGPEQDWYHKDGAWSGMCDALLEECLILQEMKEAEIDRRVVRTGDSGKSL